ncbi:MAG: CAP domain-containing protein [Candidatus Falkowbacteria bacterium]
MFKSLISELKIMFFPCNENKYSPEFLRGKFLFYFIIALILLKIAIIPFFVYFPNNVFFADITKTALINLTNQERKFSGLPILEENKKLNKAAYLKARDMIENGYFGHQSSIGISPWYWFDQVGYDYSFAGENLAVGFLDSEEVHIAWLKSYTHRKNILNPDYNEVGTAVIKGNLGFGSTTLVVQFFGTSKPIQSISGSVSAFSNGKIETDKSKIVRVFPFRELTNENQNYLIFNFFKFISVYYNNLIQLLSYALMILIIIALIINIIIKIDIQNKKLIFRAIFLIILLSISIFLDKETLIYFIPHNFYI